jgi:hypothetical protein
LGRGQADGIGAAGTVGENLDGHGDGKEDGVRDNGGTRKGSGEGSGGGASGGRDVLASAPQAVSQAGLGKRGLSCGLRRRESFAVGCLVVNKLDLHHSASLEDRELV